MHPSPSPEPESGSGSSPLSVALTGKTLVITRGAADEVVRLKLRDKALREYARFLPAVIDSFTGYMRSYRSEVNVAAGRCDGRWDCRHHCGQRPRTGQGRGLRRKDRQADPLVARPFGPGRRGEASRSPTTISVQTVRPRLSRARPTAARRCECSAHASFRRCRRLRHLKGAPRPCKVTRGVFIIP